MMSLLWVLVWQDSEPSRFPMCHDGRLFDHGICPDKQWMGLLTAHGKTLHRPLGLNAVIGIEGNAHFTQGIPLLSRLHESSQTALQAETPMQEILNEKTTTWSKYSFQASVWKNRSSGSLWIVSVVVRPSQIIRVRIRSFTFPCLNAPF